MKTIQMTIDETLLQQVDQTVEDIGTSRSAFIREALEQALHRYHIRQLEEQDAAGYIRIPAQASETEEWVTEQSWEDEWNGVR
jgi:metal-responsive CopG/Arc/MetJ family transcriptional regulator